MPKTRNSLGKFVAMHEPKSGSSIFLGILYKFMWVILGLITCYPWIYIAIRKNAFAEIQNEFSNFYYSKFTCNAPPSNNMDSVNKTNSTSKYPNEF